MLDKLKSLWARWKVQVSVVGGVLIIATAYGQCTYEVPAAEVETAIDGTAADATEATGTTTEVGTTTTTVETTEGTAEGTAETTGQE
jgi:hypothetical protein